MSPRAYCRVLPPGGVNGMITEPLPVYYGLLNYRSPSPSPSCLCSRTRQMSPRARMTWSKFSEIWQSVQTITIGYLYSLYSDEGPHQLPDGSVSDTTEWNVRRFPPRTPPPDSSPSGTIYLLTVTCRTFPPAVKAKI